MNYRSSTTRDKSWEKKSTNVLKKERITRWVKREIHVIDRRVGFLYDGFLLYLVEIVHYGCYGNVCREDIAPALS